MHSDDPPRQAQDGEQRRDRGDGRGPVGGSGDASSDGGTGGPRRRTVLRGLGGGVALGAAGTLGAAVTTAAGASFGDGVNLQPSYFCDGDQDLGYDLMREYPDIETVRIEIEPFSFNEVATTVEDAKRWIDEAAAHGLNVIATYHHYPDNGSASAAALQNAAEFWAEHYETLSADTDITVNMMNEWGNHRVTADEYAAAYDEAIDTVRSETSYSGPIVCDAPGWGQGTYRLADAVEAIDDDDLILSAHVYPSAWNATTGQNLVPEDLDVLDETSYPCMIGEFGNYANSTGADWSAIVDYASELGWPVVGWAWNGDGSADPMNMADPYWGDDCSADSYATSDYFSVVYSKLGDGGTQTPTPTDEPNTPTDEPSTPTPTDEPNTPTDTPTNTPAADALVVDDYDGDPGWSSHRNDLGQWCGAGSFENGGGEETDGALVLAYDNGGWYQTQINRDVSDYDTLVLRLRGANGGEESEVLFDMGGVRTMLSNVTDDSVGTSMGDVRVDMEAAGIDRSSPSVRFNFWQGASSTLTIEEVRLE
ncbi:cellulase family glycosylhydrolase [Halosimplex litoreum]|uniref:Cellulase family glycosylhydrolase n=1 Tax=Halosimplex litoreum TaxID=1198301 RepID=A0A7T3G0R6_9EURY|nr:cellulase family glycosylhydrolase [Halosimplex litoreum]QPV64251.1 cellulase family glycosylhydrolase [Halosimplex litoreum]